MIADNNNVVNTIINNTFTGKCIVDTGNYNIFIDDGFVKLHCLEVAPLLSRDTRVYLTAGGAKITVIVIINITLSFGNEEFPFTFQVRSKLTTGILLSMDFILKYHCIPYASDAIFTLGNGRVSVPMCVKGSGLGLAKLTEHVNLKPSAQFGRLQGSKLNNKSVTWFEFLPDTEVSHILSISHDHNHTTTDRQPAKWFKARTTDHRKKQSQYRLHTTYPSDMRTMSGPKNRKFYSQNKNFAGNYRAYHRVCKENNIGNNIDSMIQGDSPSTLSYSSYRVTDRQSSRDYKSGTDNTMEQHGLDKTVHFVRAVPFGQNGLVIPVRLSKNEK